MVVGFLTNADAVTGITAYALAKVIPLTVGTAEGSTIAISRGSYLDHITVRATNTGAVTSFNCWLSSDAAGNNPLTSEGTITVVTGITTATLIGGACVIDAWIRETSGTLYLWIKPNANTIAIAAGDVKLYWTDGFSQ